MKTKVARTGGSPRFGAGLAAAAILGALLVCTGCDSSSLVPPPPPELKKPRESGFAATYDSGSPAEVTSSATTHQGEARRPSSTSRIVELILARPSNADRDYLQLALRRELGKARLIFRVIQPDSPGAGTPAWLASAIRAAVDRGIAGLIVEPLEDPVVYDAMYDALNRGVAVLALDAAPPARGGKTIPRVAYVAIADVGREIVENVLAADRSLAHSRPGRAVVLHHRTRDDPYIERSLESLLEPLRTGGKPLEVVPFEGDAGPAGEALRKSLDNDPNIDILLVDDAYGIVAGYKVLTEWTKAGRPDFLLAGYVPYDTRTPELLSKVHAFGDRSVEAYAGRTAQAIQKLLDGKPVDDVVGIPVTFHLKQTLYVPAAKKGVEPSK